MSTVVYNCPCCGAPLAYGAESGKLECASCGNGYELEAMEELYDASQPGGIRFDMAAEAFSPQDAAYVHGYTCQGCGAELMTEETTTATECPYCGSPTILPERIEGSVKPELVIPFTVTKEQAQRQFESYFKGKKLLPNVFLNTRNRIAEMQKLYVPYWLFDCRVAGSALYEAQKQYTRREGEWEVTYTEHYALSRSGVMAFKAIPVDGSVKLDNAITESLEPYDLHAAVPFAPAVLAGAMADHADVESSDCQARARQRVENSMEQALRSTVGGYSAVVERRKGFTTEEGKVTPVFMPVWLMTTEKDGKTYTFAINGQTGKLTCDVPADKGKSWMWGGGVFAGVFMLACALLYMGGMLEDGMILLAAVFALIAAACTVGTLMGQLKQATGAHSAGNYVVQDSFHLGLCRDRHLYTTQSRRQIQQGTMAPGQRPAMPNQRVAGMGQRPVVPNQRPVVSGQRPVMPGKRSVMPGQRTAGLNQRPAGPRQKPAGPGPHSAGPGPRPGRPGSRPSGPRHR